MSTFADRQAVAQRPRATSRDSRSRVGPLPHLAQAIHQMHGAIGNQGVQRLVEGNATVSREDLVSFSRSQVGTEALLARLCTGQQTVRRDDGEESRPRTRQSPYDRIQDYVNDVAEEWRIAKDNFDRGLRRFRTTMTMTSEDEAVPDVTGALVSRVVGQVTGAAMNRLENLVPGWSQARGALDSMIGELGRAETAGRKVALRDFLLQVDDVMSRGFTRQIRAIRDGRQDTYERYESLPSDETRQAFLGSLPNWLQSVRNQIPSAEQYAASLFLEWVKRARGQISGWTSQGIIYLRFDARSRGAYRLQSATVAAPLASKVASGLNWVMQTSSLGMPNVLRLPIRKHIALLIRHGWGRSISDWAHLDENNYTVKRPIWPEGKRRWREMPLESALTAITRVRA